MAKKSHTKAKVLVGAGLALAAAAGYILSTTTARERKKFIQDLQGKVMKEVEKRYAKAKGAGKDLYEKITDEVLGEYEGIKNIDAQEFSQLGKTLKKHWQNIAEDFTKGRRSTKK